MRDSLLVALSRSLSYARGSTEQSRRFRRLKALIILPVRNGNCVTFIIKISYSIHLSPQRPRSSHEDQRPNRATLTTLHAVTERTKQITRLIGIFEYARNASCDALRKRCAQPADTLVTRTLSSLFRPEWAAAANNGRKNRLAIMHGRR